MQHKVIIQVPINDYNLYIIDIDKENNIIKFRSSLEPKILNESFLTFKDNNVQFDKFYCNPSYIKKFTDENK